MRVSASKWCPPFLRRGKGIKVTRSFPYWDHSDWTFVSWLLLGLQVLAVAAGLLLAWQLFQLCPLGSQEDQESGGVLSVGVLPRMVDNGRGRFGKEQKEWDVRGDARGREERWEEGWGGEADSQVDHGKASGETATRPPTPLDVSVYYEALCPDSRHFITRHLQPVHQKLANYLRLHLVPYGKAFTRMQEGQPTFTCQHGPLECQANKVHACGIQHVPNPSMQLAYVNCMILDNFDPQAAGAKCAEQLGVSWEPIEKCSTSEEGDHLLKQHGDITHALRPKAGFIPTITINQSQDDQVGILKNFLEVICSRFVERRPKECT